MHAGGILERCSRDVHTLLLPDDEADAAEVDRDVVQLWDGAQGSVAGGASYADDQPW